MSDLSDLAKRFIEFRDARDWKKFHNPKDVAVALTVEAAEVLELFQWHSPEDTEAFLAKNREQLEDELADVLHNLLMLSYDLNIDLITACRRKLEQNEKKYPVDKARGRANKYTNL